MISTDIRSDSRMNRLQRATIHTNSHDTGKHSQDTIYFHNFFSLSLSRKCVPLSSCHHICYCCYVISSLLGGCVASLILCIHLFSRARSLSPAFSFLIIFSSAYRGFSVSINVVTNNLYVCSQRLGSRAYFVSYQYLF